MAKWNLTGENTAKTEKHFLAEMENGVPKVYEGKIVSISDLYDAKKYQSEETEKKITIEVEIKGPTYPTPIKIPLFCTFIVTKGGGSYSNSKLFDVLETAKLLEATEMIQNTDDTVQLEFLKKNLIGKNTKFLAKTIKKGTPEMYSVIEKFTLIWG